MEQPIWAATAFSMVKGSENWFHPMFPYLTCSNLDCEFKYFTPFHYGGPGAWGLSHCNDCTMLPMWHLLPCRRQVLAGGSIKD